MKQKTDKPGKSQGETIYAQKRGKENLVREIIALKREIELLQKK